MGDDRELWDAVRLAHADRVPDFEALPQKYQGGVLAMFLVLDAALRSREPELVAVVSKLGRQLERDFGSVRNVPDGRRAVLAALGRTPLDLVTLAGERERADPSFADLPVEQLKEVVAALAPGRPGRGAQGLSLTAARLSVACGAFGDVHDKDAQAAFQGARRTATRVRPNSKRPRARAGPRTR